MNRLNYGAVMTLIVFGFFCSSQTFASDSEKIVKRQSTPDGEKISVVQDGKVKKELNIKDMKSAYEVETSVDGKSESKTISKTQEAVKQEVEKFLK